MSRSLFDVGTYGESQRDFAAVTNDAVFHTTTNHTAVIPAVTEVVDVFTAAFDPVIATAIVVRSSGPHS